MSPPTPKPPPEQDFAPPPEGYVPVIGRTPEALEDERVANEAAAFEARVKVTAEELGITLDEARESITGS